MENIQDKNKQSKANQFWETHFSEYIDDTIDENYALQIDFWTKLELAFKSENSEVIDAVMLSKIALHIANADMHLRIIKIAKQVWDHKQRQN